jgi:glycine hydroxymethyltransferase
LWPAFQGGPHNHAIAALAVALHEAAQPAFRAYAARVVRNSAALGAALLNRGFTLATGGTDNHLVLWDLRPLGVTGSKLEKLLERASVSVENRSFLKKIKRRKALRVRRSTSQRASPLAPVPPLGAAPG